MKEFLKDGIALVTCCNYYRTTREEGRVCQLCAGTVVDLEHLDSMNGSLSQALLTRRFGILNKTVYV